MEVYLGDQATNVDSMVLYVLRIEGDTSAAYLTLDNIQYSVVPEPLTMCLLGIGG